MVQKWLIFHEMWVKNIDSVKYDAGSQCPTFFEILMEYIDSSESYNSFFQRNTITGNRAKSPLNYLLIRE